MAGYQFTSATFKRMLDNYIVGTRVCLIEDGRQWEGGCGSEPAAITIRVNSPRFYSRVVTWGNLGLGESFMDGEIQMAKGELHEFLTVLLRNRVDEKAITDFRLAATAVAFRCYHAIRGKARNVRHHYEAGNDLFESFLDSSMTYSCGYAEAPDDDIEQLQANKRERILRKLRVGSGETFLDIGCGFGALVMHACERFGASALGITLSRNQLKRAQEQICKRGLCGNAEIRLMDYRSVPGTFDKIASVGMMEHVPRFEYGAYFRTIAKALKPGGLGLVHTIGCNSARNAHDPFIQKYIFPNSNQPRLSEITKGLEEAGLYILDVENNIRHYYYTLLEWLRRFRQNLPQLKTRYDPRYLRMWEYYLHCGVAAAAASDAALYQVLFTNDRSANYPLHRI